MGAIWPRTLEWSRKSESLSQVLEYFPLYWVTWCLPPKFMSTQNVGMRSHLEISSLQVSYSECPCNKQRTDTHRRKGRVTPGAQTGGLQKLPESS